MRRCISSALVRGGAAIRKGARAFAAGPSPWWAAGMHAALQAAAVAGAAGEVPVGAAVTDHNGRVIATAENNQKRHKLATAHAELLAMEAACRATGAARLDGLTLVVSLEPCTMCLGAAMLQHIGSVVYAAPSPKFGGLTVARAGGGAVAVGVPPDCGGPRCSCCGRAVAGASGAGFDAGLLPGQPGVDVPGLQLPPSDAEAQGSLEATTAASRCARFEVLTTSPHKVACIEAGGAYAATSAALLRDFFAARRKPASPGAA